MIPVVKFSSSNSAVKPDYLHNTKLTAAGMHAAADFWGHRNLPNYCTWVKTLDGAIVAVSTYPKQSSTVVRPTTCGKWAHSEHQIWCALFWRRASAEMFQRIFSFCDTRSSGTSFSRRLHCVGSGNSQRSVRLCEFCLQLFVRISMLRLQPHGFRLCIVKTSRNNG